MDDHFLERISNLEETVNNVLDHLSRLAESMETIDRNAFVSRSGLASLVETLKETNLLREDILYQRWETTMAEQMEVAAHRDRFSQMKGRFLALYRGDHKKRSSFQALVDEADFLIFSDRFQESAGALAKALRLDTRNYELAYYLAEFYQRQGLNQEARIYLDMALEANPDHADSLLVLALLCYGEEDGKKAEELLVHCLELNPFNLVALLSLGSILSVSGRHADARPLLERVNEIEPQAQSYYMLGLGAREEGRMKDAISFLKQAVEMDPEHEDAIFALGMAYLTRGWTRKARICFSQALELNPNNLEYQEASDAVVPPKVEEPTDLDVESTQTLDFAKSLFVDGKFKQALPHYRQLLRKYPGNQRILIDMAALSFALRRFDDTLKTTAKILTLDAPETTRRVAYTLQMESYRALNRYEEAIDCLNAMAVAFPLGTGRAIANYGLAMTMADLGHDLKQAQSLAEEALELSPPEFRHNVLDALGWVYFKQGRFEDALGLLESAIAMHETVNHLYHYGMVLLALNLKEEAFKVFERTVKLRTRSNLADEYAFSSLHANMDGLGHENDY